MILFTKSKQSEIEFVGKYLWGMLRVSRPHLREFFASSLRGTSTAPPCSGRTTFRCWRCSFHRGRVVTCCNFTQKIIEVRKIFDIEMKTKGDAWGKMS